MQFTQPNPPPPPPPSNPQPGPARACSGRPNEFIPDRTRCNVYHICLPNGSTQEDRCPGRLLFDININRCRARENVQCFPGAAIPQGIREGLDDELLDEEINEDEEAPDAEF